MLKRIIDLPDNVLGIEASGEVTADDYQSVLVPALEEKLRMIRKVRFLYVLGVAIVAAHFRFVKEHRQNVNRLAIVSTDRVLSALPFLAKHFLVKESRHFSMDKKNEALAWVSQG